MKKIWLLIIMLVLPISVYADSKDIYIAWNCNNAICMSEAINVDLANENNIETVIKDRDDDTLALDVESITCYNKQDCSIPDYLILDQDISLSSYFSDWNDLVSFVYASSPTIRLQHPFRFDATTSNYIPHIVGGVTDYNPGFGPSSRTMMSSLGNDMYTYTWNGKTVADFQDWQDFEIAVCPNTNDNYYNSNNCFRWTEGGIRRITEVFIDTNSILILSDAATKEKTDIIIKPMNSDGSNDTKKTISIGDGVFSLKIGKEEQQQPETPTEIESEPELMVYKVLDGNDQIYNKALENDLTFRFDIEYAKFLASGKVYVDDKEVDKSNYTSKEGSTIITFTKTYADSLSIGNHTVSVRVANGYSTANFTVVNNPIETTSTVNNPDTLDNINIYLLLFILSIISITGLFILRKQKN